MTGSEYKFVRFLAGSSKSFRIPLYQRNYDWKQENCRQLYDDLIKVVRGRRSHFFGSIVYLLDPDKTEEEYLIIDGQQRLTTVSLLLLAMHNLLKDGTITSSDPKLRDRIMKEYLIDEWKEGDARIKLKSTNNDKLAFDRLFSDEKDYIRESKLTSNYEYFCKRIKAGNTSIDQLFDAIGRLEIITIALKPKEDNPQLIFESLNSTGLALSAGDKIRNYMLMGLSNREQNRYYKDYWSKIEEYAGDDVSPFVRDYLCLKLRAIPRQDEVYNKFKSYVEEEWTDDTEALLSELLAYARRYKTLLTGNTDDSMLNGSIQRLHRLETTVTHPFFLEVLRLREEKVITPSEADDIFLTTETFLFRRMICELPTNALNKLFTALHWEIVRYDGTTDHYAEKFKYALLSKTSTGRFPSDEEFREAFSTRDIYSMTAKNKAYIFERLENAGTKEDKDIYRHLDEGTYTIEHIMPQTLTEEWEDALGDDCEEIHEEWLHKLANLTLTAYNSQYSNRSFEEKKNMPNGFAHSGIRLNNFIASQDQWTARELALRNDILMDEALTLWPLPATNFQPVKREKETYTLDDDIDMTGRNIASYRYKDQESSVKNWIDFYIQVLKLLHEQDPSVLTSLAAAPADVRGLSSYFSTDPDILRNAIPVVEGIYTEGNTSTEAKLNILTRLFDKYGEDTSILTYSLRAEESTVDNPYAQDRLDYWTYALPIIKASAKAYNNVSPAARNYLDGFLGVRGYHLACFVSKKSATIYLYIEVRTTKAENTAAFDRLLAHKEEIESALGTPLIWDRGEHKKSAEIGLRLTGVNVCNKDDHPQMAAFHALWAQRFTDVFLPLLG